MSNGVLYVLTVTIWGSTWLAIALQIGVVAPEVSVFYRYALAAALMFAWSRLRGLRLRFPLRDHAVFATLGLTLFSVNFILMYNAEALIGSALAAVVFASLVWMNMLNARAFFSARIEARSVAGSLLGMAGILLLFLPQVRDVSLDDGMVFGAVLALAGTLVASLGNMMSQSAQRRNLPVLQANAWGMLYGAGISLVFAMARGTEINVDWSPAYLLSLAYLVIFGSIVGFGAYLTLLGRIGAHRAGYASIAFPVVAVVLAMVFEGLEPGVHGFAGIALVLAGNLLAMGGQFGLKLRSRRAPAVGPRAIDPVA